MQADHIALGVNDQGNVAILTDARFGFEEPPPCGLRAPCLYRAVVTDEINQPRLWSSALMKLGNKSA